MDITAIAGRARRWEQRARQACGLGRFLGRSHCVMSHRHVVVGHHRAAALVTHHLLVAHALAPFHGLGMSHVVTMSHCFRHRHGTRIARVGHRRRIGRRHRRAGRMRERR